MSTMIMNMSQGNIERDEPAVAGYGVDLAYAGCSTVLAMSQLVPENKQNKRGAFPATLASADLELFLQKMHG